VRRSVYYVLMRRERDGVVFVKGLFVVIPRTGDYFVDPELVVIETGSADQTLKYE
jgi:hypothetical protein